MNLGRILNKLTELQNIIIEETGINNPIKAIKLDHGVFDYLIEALTFDGNPKKGYRELTLFGIEIQADKSITSESSKLEDEHPKKQQAYMAEIRAEMDRIQTYTVNGGKDED